MGVLEHVFYQKCNFRRRDITLLLLQQLLVNFTHGYATPCAGHCTNETKDRSSLHQPSPRQPKQKVVNATGFLKWKYDFLWYGSVINERNATYSPATPKDTSHPWCPGEVSSAKNIWFLEGFPMTVQTYLHNRAQPALAAVKLVFQVCVFREP